MVPQWLLDFQWTMHSQAVEQEALVQWCEINEDATWEPYDNLKNRFSDLNLEDKIRIHGEGNVMTQTSANRPASLRVAGSSHASHEHQVQLLNPQHTERMRIETNQGTASMG